MLDKHNAQAFDQINDQSDMDHRSTVRIAKAATDLTTPMHSNSVNASNHSAESRQSLTLTHKKALPQSKQLTIGAIVFLGFIETVLTLISLVPATYSIRLGWSATNGPFPASLAPLITIAYYGIPTVVGFLGKRWDLSLLAASMPAWIGIGVYNVVASGHDGFFAMTHGAQPTYLVGTLELFAFLGFIGWIARCVFLPHLTERTVKI